MSRYRVLVTDYAWPSLEIERALLASVDAELVVAETGEEPELVALARDVDAILTNWKRVPPTVLEAASDCLAVARYGVGVDNIPVELATDLGMLVVNVPDFCVDEVTDHAMALLLACARRVVTFSRSTREGSWDLAGLGSGLPRLRDQTLGIVGFGNTGRALVPKARGFGIRVLVYSPRPPAGPVDADVEVTTDLSYLLSEADYVSLHAPASQETRNLIGAKQLESMKQTAYLINTSRGSLVDEAALYKALCSGAIAGAALDVLVVEPPSPDHRLLTLDNVIVTPHAAFYSEAAITELQTKAAANVVAVLRGEIPLTVVNREVLERPNLRCLH